MRRASGYVSPVPMGLADTATTEARTCISRHYSV
jgi:hypothetical protein